MTHSVPLFKYHALRRRQTYTFYANRTCLMILANSESRTVFYAVSQPGCVYRLHSWGRHTVYKVKGDIEERQHVIKWSATILKRSPALDDRAITSTN